MCICTYIQTCLSFFSEAANECEFSDFRDEIAIMKIIGYHKNVVNMIGCSTIKKPLCLVVEYMENGDLLTFLRHNRATVSKVFLTSFVIIFKKSNVYSLTFFSFFKT